MSFPYDFGFLPSTLGDDGDPLDVLVLADEALPPGCVVPCRIAGVIEAEQQDAGKDRAERNDRLIAVADKSHRYRHCASLDDIAADVLDEVENFFVFYNQQKGGSFEPLARRGLDAAPRARRRRPTPLCGQALTGLAERHAGCCAGAIPPETFMASETAHDSARDPAHIEVDDETSLHEWADKLDTTADQLRDAVAAVGSRASDVEMHLKGTRSTTNSDRVEDDAP